MANDVKVNVKTTHEGKGVIDRLVESLRGIKAEGGAAAKSIDAFVGIIRGPFAAIAAVASSVAAAFSGVSKAIAEFADAEQKVAKLDAALAQNGLLADDVREQYQELATELQKTTAIADDEWLAVLTKLTQFGSKPETIGMDVEAVKNLAGVVGDLQTAATMYSKALQGSFSAFSRYGIIITENATATEKLRDLQEQLARIGGGQLDASATTLNGQWAKLKNATADLSEAIGGQIAKTGILQEVMATTTEVTEYWAEKLGGTIGRVNGLSNAVQDTTESLRAYKEELAIVEELSSRITKAIEQEVKAIREKQSALDEIAGAQVALDIAKVNEAERKGQLTPEQATIAKGRIRAAAAAAKHDRDKEADIQEYKAKEKAFSDQLTITEGLGKRRAEIEKQLAKDGPLASKAEMAKKQADAIRDEQRARSKAAENGSDRGMLVGTQMAGVGAVMGNAPLTMRGLASVAEARRRERAGFQDVSDEELQSRLEKSQLAGPSSLDGLRSELNDVTKNEREARARAQTMFEDLNKSSTPSRVARRDVVYGINKERESIETRSEAAGSRGSTGGNQVGAVTQSANAATAALDQTLGAILGLSNAITSYAHQVSQNQTNTNARLRALESGLKNAHNR